MIMNNKKLLLLLFLFLTQLFPSDNSFSQSCAKFGLKMLKTQKENTVFSPYSIEQCFLMAYLGAAKETEKEIKNALFLKGKKESILTQAYEMNQNLEKMKAINLQIANALWLESDFRLLPSYQDRIKKYFQANFFTSDNGFLQSLQEINQWVEGITRGQIKQILTPDDLGPMARLILINALYLKAEWSLPFIKDDTQRKDFFTKNGPIPTDMMMQTGNFLYSQKKEYQIAALPFKNQNLLFIVILPNHKQDLQYLEREIEDLDSCLNGLAYKKLNFSMPKFKFSNRLNLKKLINMPLSFSENADFSNLSKESLYLYSALHETVFNLDESGVEASAVTSISFNTTGYVEEDSIEFNVNHPFIFMVIEKNSKTPLFLGRYVHP